MYLISSTVVFLLISTRKQKGFFGGQGFILQRLSGQGDVLVKAGGTLVEKELEEGESLRVTSGSIVAFTKTVDYDIQMMPGIKNAMFGGEGLFVTKLTGPGKVWLQGMPADRMISEIARRVPAGGLGLGIPLGVGGGGGGEDAATVEGAGDAAADASETESGEEMVAATDAAVDADRNATVASSGMMESEAVDSESPESLFGDAAPKDSSTSSSNASEPSASTMTPEDSSFQEDTFKETTFTDDGTSATEETSFSDDNSFSTSDDFDQQQSQDDFFDDQTTTDVFESGSEAASEDAAESGMSFLKSVWDFFMDDD